MNIIIFSKSTWNVLNFRKNLIKEMIKNGWNVYVVAKADTSKSDLESIGCKIVPIKINNKSINPLNDLILFLKILKIYYSIKPNVTCHFNIKPVIYGSMASRILKIPSINMITGLGTAFLSKSWINGIVKLLYYLSLKKTSSVFFQNEDDKNLFLKNNLVPYSSVYKTPGSGIDLEYFQSADYPKNKDIYFLLISRILWDKGIKEYVEAARYIKLKYENISFNLLGPIENESNSEISLHQVKLWTDEGIINYLGSVNDVRQYIKDCHCVVLPSYREGTPKSLLEAAAMARPAIATNVVGCKEVVNDGQNGFLCENKNYISLAETMEKFISLSYHEKRKMGLKGREKVVEEFDEKIVINNYIENIRKIIDYESHEKTYNNAK